MADRDRLLHWLDEFYAFFLGEIGGTSVTPLQAYDLMSENRRATSGGATVPSGGQRPRVAA
jgi:hypothetical protein